MNFEKMTYSTQKVNECVEKISRFSFAAKKKSEHFNRLMELRKLFDLCSENTTCVLFREDWANCLTEYSKAVSNGKSTKKELDKLLKACELYIKWEIMGIRKMMLNGEVNVIYD